MSGYLFTFVSWVSQILPLSLKKVIYKIKPLAVFIRSSLNIITTQELQEVTVSAGGLKGKRFYLNLKTQKAYWLGTYEPALISELGKAVKKSLVVYDVGANIGYLTVFIADQISKRGRVFAFEPLPKNIQRLKSNIQLNNFQEKVQVVPLAVIDSRRSIQFYSGPSDSTGRIEGSVGRDFINTNPSITIQGTSLDEFIFDEGNPSPSVVKMDIEGGEVLALKGMQKMLFVYKPIVYLEIHGPEAAEIAIDTFEKIGYQIYLLGKNQTIVRSINDLGWKAYVVARPI